MAVKKIWVKSKTGVPQPRPFPDTRRKPPITVPVQVVDSPGYRRLIANSLEPLMLCDEPGRTRSQPDAAHPDSSKDKENAKKGGSKK